VRKWSNGEMAFDHGFVLSLFLLLPASAGAAGDA